MDYQFVEHCHPFSAVWNNLNEFMRDGVFTDVVFNVGLSEFTAHKVILASSSSVFRAMFSNGMQESGSNTVIELTDTNAESFSIFLNYIYTRDNTIVKGHFGELLHLADKYDVEPLADLCDESFEKLLTVENAVDTLIIAHKYSRTSLKAKVSLFLKKHRNAVSSCESWEKLKTDMVLLNELLCKFVGPGNDSSSSPGKYSFPGVARSANEVVWALQNNVWEHEDEVMAPVTLCLRGNRNSELFLFQVSLINRKGELSIKIKGDRPFPLTIKVTRRKEGLLRNSSTIYLLQGRLEEMVLYVPRILDLNYAYPFDLSVVLEKTPTSGVHPPPDYTEDAKLRVENVTIPVHKSVLADSSEFFSNLFGKERVIEEYPIDGIPARTLKLLVHFMYSLRMTDPENVDLPLLQGAHRFKLEELVEHCESNLITKITIENALKTYEVAEEIGLDRLGDSVKTFIMTHADDIARTGQLWEFESSELLKELFLSVGR